MKEDKQTDRRLRTCSIFAILKVGKISHGSEKFRAGSEG